MPNATQRDLIRQVLTIYSVNTIQLQLTGVSGREWSRKSLYQMVSQTDIPLCLTPAEVRQLGKMLPGPPDHHPHYAFRFIDLFAGIGGIRKGFDNIGGQCVLTCEWNKEALRTYRANWYNDEREHQFVDDIRSITLSDRQDISASDAYQHIADTVPDHDVLLAGFPCQPFSLAGVSKKNALGRNHGFECKTQGTLFFDVARIIRAKQPAIFVLENVKNLKSHNKGNTFRVIMDTLSELGYDVADASASGADDPKVIDARHFLPQHRERVVLVGFRRNLNLAEGFSLRNIVTEYPPRCPTIKALLDDEVDDKYILTPRLWDYLYRYARKHREKGNGFGFSLVNTDDAAATCRTLSARYHKDGSEILIDRGWDPEMGEHDFFSPMNMARRPRRLTPRECARLMGFERPGERQFIIPVSDTQAYRQFGNSVVVPVFAAVARLLEPYILRAISGQ
ncbi:DNA (cytosine-5-)-methyltransferase [Salmonella enterica subsp. enterica]|nr:DNA (cytosine-5-)-methyltransferase [Salmonella enterica subsp. enterica serovar Virchow]